MNVNDAVRGLRAVRQFIDQPVPREQIEHIVNAGRLSGSAKNTQPWDFVVIEDRVVLQTLAGCGEWCGHLAGAAFAVVMVTPDLHARETLTVPYDLGRASQNMMLLALEFGLGSCPATIYKPEIAREALGIPSDMDVPWAFSFGYPQPQEPRSPSPNGRKTAAEVIHWERW